MKMYSIYDSKAKYYMNPFIQRNHAEALRSLTQAVKDPQTTIAKHPADFVLMYLGDFNDENGQIDPSPERQSLAVAIELLDAQI